MTGSWFVPCNSARQPTFWRNRAALLIKHSLPVFWNVDVEDFNSRVFGTKCEPSYRFRYVGF